MNQKFTFWIKFILGILIIFFLFKKVGFIGIYQSILGINLSLFLIFLVLVFLNFLLGIINIKILLNFIKKVNLVSLFKPYFYSWSFGLFSPGKLGEFSLPLFLKKYHISIGTGAAVLLIDKGITICYLILLSFFAFVFFNMNAIGIPLLVLVLLLFVFSVCLYSLKIRKIIRKYILRKYRKEFTGFSQLIFDYINYGKKYLVANTILTIIKFLVIWLSSYFLFLSLGLEVPLIHIALVGAVAWLSGLIPITINGLGVKQSVALFLFVQLSVSASIVLAHQAIIIAINYSIASSFLINYIISKKKFGS